MREWGAVFWLAFLRSCVSPLRVSSTAALPLSSDGDDARASLESAWRTAGGSASSYRERRPVPLTEYEEGKLSTAGVDLSACRPFFEKAKALMGERSFELFAASEAERSETRSARGRQFGGVKPTNPTGLIIRLVIHRIAEQKNIMATGSTPSSEPVATRPQAELVSVVAEPPSTLSKTRHARASRQLALLDKVQDATGELATTDVVYCSTAFVVASLPHSDPGTKETWSRTNGRKVLTVRSGWNEESQAQFGLPYGSLPRLMYYYVESEVIRKQEQKVYLGESLYAFMQSLGISDNAANYRALRAQAARLFNASFQITERKTSTDGGPIGVNIKHVPPIAKEAEFWWHPDRKGGNTCELFSSYIVLEDKFYREMLEHGFPLDSNAVKFLRQSSLDLDLYAWITHRNYSLNKFDTQNVEISYDALMEQFGSEYARARDFRAKLKQGLSRVSEVWRGGLEYELTKSGLVLKKSPLQIKAAR